VKTQECFANDNLVTIAQRLTLSRWKALATVDKGPVGRPQVFQKILTVRQRYASMSARHLSFRVISVQVHIWKDSTVSIPSTDVSFDIAQHKLFTTRPSLFDYQSRVRACRLLYGPHI
jgi:hypothetical protein